MSANFVIPYPPGFPIMVPGQVLTRETIEFMRKLDVKEIHGYKAPEGSRSSGRSPSRTSLVLWRPERAGTRWRRTTSRQDRSAEPSP